MRSKGSRFTLGVWGLRVCSLDVASASATVRNRSQPFATVRVRTVWPCLWEVLQRWSFLEVSDVWFVSRGRRGTLWHSDVFCNASKIVLCGRCNTFATFPKDVLQFSWQAQHFGRVQCHFSWQAQHFRRVGLRVFRRSHWQGCGTWRQGANSVAGVAFRDMSWKLTEASHETLILRLQNLEVPRKTRRKTSILKLQSVKIGGSLARNARFGAPTCLVSSLWFSCGLAVSMGEASLFGSFWHVSKQVVMSFCVAGVALCDIRTCLITCRKCQNWRKSRTKCWFLCIHVSRLGSLVFLWHRRVYGGSCKTSPFRSFPTMLSCRFAWQAWHFVTFQRVWQRAESVSGFLDTSRCL